MIPVFRDAAWLTTERARAYALILTLSLAIAAGVTYNANRQQAASNPGGLPTATDFVPFFAAGQLVLQGSAPDAYRLDVLDKVERQHAVLRGGRLPFMYPPPMLALCALVAMLPYGLAWLAFQAIGVVPLLLALRRIVTEGAGWTLLAAMPAVLMNAGSGQTGAHTAACFAVAAVMLDKRPILAGMVLGLLAAKPHLAPLVPLALLCAGRWRALVSCGATALALYAASWLIFGNGVWLAFLAQAHLAQEVLEHWSSNRSLVSMFGALRLLGAGLQLCYGAQILFSLAVAFVVARVALRRPGGLAEMAVTGAGALAATPYAMDYDLPNLLLPSFFVLAAALRHGWLPWEKLALGIGFMLPLFVRILVLLASLPVAPPFLAVTLLLAARRATAERPA